MLQTRNYAVIVLLALGLLIGINVQPALAQSNGQPKQMVAKADKLASSDPDQALSIYKQVISNDDAPGDVRATARAHMAQLNRNLNPEKTDAKELIASAFADIKEGKFDSAKNKLSSAQSRSSNLGWFDKQRISRGLEVVNNQVSNNSKKKEAAEAAAQKAWKEAEDAAKAASDKAAASEKEQQEAIANAKAKKAAALKAQKIAKQKHTQSAEATAQKAWKEAEAASKVAQTKTAANKKAQANKKQAQQKSQVAKQKAKEARANNQLTASHWAKQAAHDAWVQNGHQAPGKLAATDLLTQSRIAWSNHRTAQGKKAQQGGNYKLATHRYQQALKLNPANKEAKKGLKFVRSAQANKQIQAKNGESLLDKQMEHRGLKIQAAKAEYNSAVNDAHNKYSAGRFDASLDDLNSAKMILENNRTILPSDEYQNLMKHVQYLIAGVSDQKVKVASNQKRKTAANRKLEAMRQQRKALQEKASKVQKILKQAMELRQDMKYDQAIKLVKQALFIDPTNFAAQAILKSIQNDQILVKSRKLDRKFNLNYAKQMIETKKASIPYTELVRYPADWPQLTKKRLEELKESGGSAGNRGIMQVLDQNIPVDFEGVPFDKVIDYFRANTGLNFIANWSALRTAGVQKDTAITLKLKNVSAKEALDQVIKKAAGPNSFEPIGWSVVHGIVTVSTQRDINSDTDIRVYDIRDLLINIPVITQVPEFDLSESLSGNTKGRQLGQGSGGGGGGGSNNRGLIGRGNRNNSRNQGKQRQQKREDTIKSITDLIKSSVGKPENWFPDTGNSSVTELNGNLIVKSTPNNHRQISELLSKIREDRSIQISVEARFLLVGNDFLQDIGADLDMELTNPGGNFGPIKIAQDSSSLVTPSYAAFGGGSGGGGSSGGGGGSGAINPGSNPMYPGTFVPGAGFLPQNGRAMSFGASFIGDFKVNLLIRATQANERDMTLTAPRVTFLNGHAAYVLVADQRLYISDLKPVPDASGWQPTVSVLQTGVLLYVEGAVSPDRRYVLLTLQPKTASLKDFRTVQFTGTSRNNNNNNNDDDDNSRDTFKGQVELPEIEITEVVTTVSVPDRGTLLIGGQKLAGKTEKQAGVPVLSKIPIINRLFSNESTTKSQKTLLILVKPTIIMHNEQENKQFPGLLDNPMGYDTSHSY